MSATNRSSQQRRPWRWHTSSKNFLMALVTLVLVSSQLLLAASALPTTRDMQMVPTISTKTEMSSFVTPAIFAADAYCTSLLAGQSVGHDGTVLWETGNGNDLQMAYVAYSPTLGIVVAHQGTNRSSSASIENDLRIRRVPLDDRLRNMSSSPLDVMLVAEGFQNAWLDTADEVVEQVRLALQAYPNASVTMTGHSLGAAISLLDAVYVQQSLGVPVNAILFGMPRVGNELFANAVDRQLQGRQRHIINANDPVPHLPFRSMGFRHPSGQVWIASMQVTTAAQTLGRSFKSGMSLACPGQENQWCADSVDFRQFRVSDHNGPYYGVDMECTQVPNEL